MRLTKKACRKMMLEDYTRFYAPMPEDWKKLFPVMTVAELEEMGLHFTVNHQGKMAGMISLSTTCKCNDLCIARIASTFSKFGFVAADKATAAEAKKFLRDYIASHPLATDICICGFCFSDTLQDRQESMKEPLSRNYEILNNGIIHPDWIPTLNALYFRGESFGDFRTVNAVVNFYRIAEKNRGTHCTAWTKNLVFFRKAEEAGYKRPDNFKLILSAHYINARPEVKPENTHLVDAVFTVYTPEYAELHNITINCGARACLACLRCYTLESGNIMYVNELLK